MSTASLYPPATARHPAADTFHEDFVAGLRARPRSISPKHFYDAAGSVLFESICEQPEYFPTRTELALLRTHACEISDCCGGEVRVVELGSGSSVKTHLLLDALEAPAAYIPIEISESALRSAAQKLKARFPAVDVRPICADFTAPFRLPDAGPAHERTVFFFPGSTIGNFEPDEASAFLARLARIGGPGSGLLIGLGLQTDRATLESAYNDAAGVTAAFNLNLLMRAQRECGARLDLDGFRHEAVYNEAAARIEMRLVSRLSQCIAVDGEEFPFAVGDAILTEYSHKFTLKGFRAFAARAGFALHKTWQDPQARFAIAYCEVEDAA